jgi:hypothetical protein
MSSNKVSASLEQMKRLADKALGDAERYRAQRDAAYATVKHARADELLVRVAEALNEANDIAAASVAPPVPDPDTANVSVHHNDPSRPPPSTTPAHRYAAKALVNKVSRAVSEFHSAVQNDFPKREDSRVKCEKRGCDRYGRLSEPHHHCPDCKKSSVDEFCAKCGAKMVLPVDNREALRMEKPE